MVEKQESDLSALRIDPSRKGPIEPPRRRSRKPFVAAAAAVAAVWVGFVIVRALAAVPAVRVVRVRLESNRRGAAGSVVLTAGGYIVAHHTIEVSSKVIGKVAWVGVEKGDVVKKGQVLVRLDDSEFRAQLEQAQANLLALEAKLQELEAGSRPQEIAAAFDAVEQAKADNGNAQLTLRRERALFQQGIVSRSDLDNAVAQANIAQAKLASAQENYQITKIGPRVEDINYARAQVAQAQASVDYARTQLDGTVIRAPVSGTVLERNVEVGELVSNMNFGGSGGVKTSVVTLANLSDLQVELDINETDFARISPNQRCTITADAYPDRVYQGVVQEISPEANRQKGTIQVKVKILHPDAYLRPEMSAHVSFLASGRTGAPDAILAVPHSAVVSESGRPAVFVLRGSHVQLVRIQVGRPLADGWIEAVSGLGPNDRVVVGAPAGLASGERVKLKGA